MIYVTILKQKKIKKKYLTEKCMKIDKKMTITNCFNALLYC